MSTGTIPLDICKKINKNKTLATLLSSHMNQERHWDDLLNVKSGSCIPSLEFVNQLLDNGTEFCAHRQGIGVYIIQDYNTVQQLAPTVYYVVSLLQVKGMCDFELMKARC